MNKGFFITFEGCEGCGKSTQSNLLYQYLKKKGLNVVHTREPGGTRAAESIRKVLLDPRNSITPLAELLLYEASRAQHAAEVILPALKAGSIVICDRFTDATLAYQGYARGLDLDTIQKLNRIATQGLVPDLTILLDIAVEEGLAKARGLKKGSFATGDRLEREDVSFHRKVRKGYLALARKEPKRIKIIKTASTIEKTQQKIRAAIDKVLSGR
jgi:dTMP kinase